MDDATRLPDLDSVADDDLPLARWGKIAAAGKGDGCGGFPRPTTQGWDGRGMPQVAERQTNPIFTQSNPKINKVG
ncbi:MAG: hypothetical protein Ct9H300mP7_1370 [Verrucomicrobiota bacterium]|nr:MAG: hypothetical protein Ct9H300mP7_1370 [Verrucomicrobiota bacterium]